MGPATTRRQGGARTARLARGAPAATAPTPGQPTAPPVQRASPPPSASMPHQPTTAKVRRLGCCVDCARIVAKYLARFVDARAQVQGRRLLVRAGARPRPWHALAAFLSDLLFQTHPSNVMHASLGPFSAAVPLCPAGTGGLSAWQGPCSTCPLGFFSAGGTLNAPYQPCSMCPAGNTTTATGATSAAQCTSAYATPPQLCARVHPLQRPCLALPS